MNIEQNKHLANEFYRRFSASDIPGVLATMTDDAAFWIAGKPGRGLAGTLTKDRIGKVFNDMLGQLKHGLKMTVKSTIAEGDKVALEVASCGELRNGRIYDQEYHALMVLRDGKIAAIHEYLETLHANEVWFARFPTAQNKQLLEHAFAETAKGNGRTFLDAMADDVSWTIIGSTPWSKTYRGKQQLVAELLQPLRAQFAGNTTIVANRFIGEDDYVVVEARGQAATKTGRQYRNSYCWVFRFMDGKIIEIMEYADTALIDSVLDAPNFGGKENPR